MPLAIVHDAAPNQRAATLYPNTSAGAAADVAVLHRQVAALRVDKLFCQVPSSRPLGLSWQELAPGIPLTTDA